MFNRVVLHLSPAKVSKLIYRKIKKNKDKNQVGLRYFRQVENALNKRKNGWSHLSCSQLHEIMEYNNKSIRSLYHPDVQK